MTRKEALKDWLKTADSTVPDGREGMPLNLRVLKKREKRAAKLLIQKHGYSTDDFTPSDGTESMYAPKDLNTGLQRHGFIKTGPLRGTPLLWERVSYEYDEWDARFPSEVLADLEFDWESAINEMLAADSPVLEHSEIRRENE